MLKKVSTKFMNLHKQSVTLSELFMNICMLYVGL